MIKRKGLSLMLMRRICVGASTVTGIAIDSSESAVDSGGLCEKGLAFR